MDFSKSLASLRLWPCRNAMIYMYNAAAAKLRPDREANPRDLPKAQEHEIASWLATISERSRGNGASSAGHVQHEIMHDAARRFREQVASFSAPGQHARFRSERISSLIKERLRISRARPIV
jgi:hypothetical protein